MNRLNPMKCGMTLGTVIAPYHAASVTLVAIGLAQPLMDFIFWVHFLKPMLVIEVFDPGKALLLLTVTFTVGFLVGLGFALSWNRFHRAA